LQWNMDASVLRGLLTEVDCPPRILLAYSR
jgi:hypothetical protein